MTRLKERRISPRPEDIPMASLCHMGVAKTVGFSEASDIYVGITLIITMPIRSSPLVES